MKIVCVGGGSGGHVTPVLAVLNELKQLDPELEATFVTDRSFETQARGLMSHALAPVSVHTIVAGKLRRYHGVSWWRQLLDIPTTLKNIRDVILVGVGIVQSLALLARLKPDVVFAKGGYVCLPLGLAARLRRIPVVIHDSDTRAGLTNRVLGKFAERIATGAPLQNYHYPLDRSRHTGVPIDRAFHPFSEEEQRAAKVAIGLSDPERPLLVVTGGGLGAKSINDAMVAIGPAVLKAGCQVYHITGKKHFKALEKQLPHSEAYQAVEFVYKDQATVLGAADIVVARGSATFLQELAALQKPVIVVPAEHLSDQVKNAAVYQEAEAALVLSDKELVRHPELLLDAITQLMEEPAEAHHLAAQLHGFARPDAAERVAELIMEVYQPRVKVKGGDEDGLAP